MSDEAVELLAGDSRYYRAPRGGQKALHAGRVIRRGRIALPCRLSVGTSRQAGWTRSSRLHRLRSRRNRPPVPRSFGRPVARYEAQAGQWDAIA